MNVEQAAQNGYTYFPDYRYARQPLSGRMVSSRCNQYQQTHGARLLDYLDLHFYPATVWSDHRGDVSQQALRLRSTRSCGTHLSRQELDWRDSPACGLALCAPDPAHARLDQHRTIPAPGWRSQNTIGAGLEHINGALAQADLLRIFGREELDLATLWNYPGAAWAMTILRRCRRVCFRMYRNYDDAGSTFGDVSVSAAIAIRPPVALCRTAQAGDDSAHVHNHQQGDDDDPHGHTEHCQLHVPATAQVYRYSDADLNRDCAILPDQAVGASGSRRAFPANSITLARLAGSAAEDKVYLPMVIDSLSQTFEAKDLRS